MLKYIMNWCKIRKNFVLFSLKDYVMLNLLISYDNEIYDFQGNLFYFFILFCKYVEEINRDNIIVIYV